MSNVDELVEEVARVIDPGAWWPELHIDSARKRRSAARHRSKAAIKAVLEGIRLPSGKSAMCQAAVEALNNTATDDPKATAWDWSVAHRAAIDALLKQLED